MLVRPEGVVRDVDGWEYAPCAVDLRVVSVDFGDEEENGGKEERDCKGEDKGIGAKVENL